MLGWMNDGCDVMVSNGIHRSAFCFLHLTIQEFVLIVLFQKDLLHVS